VLTPETLPEVQAALAEAGLDGWLLFDFHGLNPVVGGLLHLEGMLTRRIFVYVPRLGAPTAVTHTIEQGPWAHWPAGWSRVVYSGWRELEAAVGKLVAGRRVAMEYSPGDAVPYLDRVPAGVLELVRTTGAVVVSSGELVSRFYAAWNAEQIAAHRRAAALIAETAVDALRMAGERATVGSPLTEYAIQKWILERIARAGLVTQDAPIVATGPHAANPHYGPSETDPTVVNRGDVLLIDLWAREPGQPFADETWMGVLGNADGQTVKVWEAVRDARDAAIRLLRERASAGKPIRGSEVDDAARAVIESRGYGPEFSHRTGHSIDPRDIHGSGPHIDNLESREDRLLIPGVAFSIEPGIYIKDVLGVRSEVNAVMQRHEVLITPDKYQRDLLIV
jgi:Xaa-Pro aminopeptidase